MTTREDLVNIFSGIPCVESWEAESLADRCIQSDGVVCSNKVLEELKWLNFKQKDILKYIPESFQNKELVAFLINHNASSLRFAKYQDQEIVELAISRNPMLLEHVSIEHQNDENIMLAVQRMPHALAFAKKQSSEIVGVALKKNADAIVWVLPHLLSVDLINSIDRSAVKKLIERNAPPVVNFDYFATTTDYINPRNLDLPLDGIEPIWDLVPDNDHNLRYLWSWRERIKRAIQHLEMSGDDLSLDCLPLLEGIVDGDPSFLFFTDLSFNLYTDGDCLSHPALRIAIEANPICIKWIPPSYLNPRLVLSAASNDPSAIKHSRMQTSLSVAASLSKDTYVARWVWRRYFEDALEYIRYGDLERYHTNKAQYIGREGIIAPFLMLHSPHGEAENNEGRSNGENEDENKDRLLLWYKCQVNNRKLEGVGTPPPSIVRNNLSEEMIRWIKEKQEILSPDASLPEFPSIILSDEDPPAFYKFDYIRLSYKEDWPPDDRDELRCEGDELGTEELLGFYDDKNYRIVIFKKGIGLLTRKLKRGSGFWAMWTAQDLFDCVLMHELGHWFNARAVVAGQVKWSSEIVSFDIHRIKSNEQLSGPNPLDPFEEWSEAPTGTRRELGSRCYHECWAQMFCWLYGVQAAPGVLAAFSALEENQKGPYRAWRKLLENPSEKRPSSILDLGWSENMILWSLEWSRKLKSPPTFDDPDHVSTNMLGALI